MYIYRCTISVHSCKIFENFIVLQSVFTIVHIEYFVFSPLD